MGTSAQSSQSSWLPCMDGIRVVDGSCSHQETSHSSTGSGSSSFYCSRLFKAITGFLVFAIFMLCVEVAAHLMGWHFPGPYWAPAFQVQNLAHSIYLGWLYLRAEYIAPPLQLLINFCICLFLIQSADRIILCIGCMWIKWKNIKPIPVNPSLESDDIEQPDKGYPMVLVQIPMCNEREVCSVPPSTHRLVLLVLRES
jgi:hypothetical protein